MTFDNKSPRQAVIFLWVTALLWSFIGVLLKNISWNPLAIACIACAAAATIQIPLIGRRAIVFRKGVLGGAVIYAINVLLFFSATKLTTAASAALLQSAAPLFVALFGAWFLKERTTRADWIMIALVLGGMTLFFCDHLSQGELSGNVLAIISSATVALYTLALRREKDDASLTCVLLGNILVSIVCLPFVTGANFSLCNITNVLLLGVICYGISYIFYCNAIKDVRALDAVLITTKEPVLNGIWVFLVVKEIPGVFSLIGGAVVLLSVFARSIAIAREQDNTRVVSLAQSRALTSCSVDTGSDISLGTT